MAMHRVPALITHTVNAMKLLAKDERVPRWLRWVAAISLLPIPGPFDEAVLLLVAPIFAVFYRQPLREAWQHGADPDRRSR